MQAQWSLDYPAIDFIQTVMMTVLLKYLTKGMHSIVYILLEFHSYKQNALPHHAYNDNRTMSTQLLSMVSQ